MIDHARGAAIRRTSAVQPFSAFFQPAFRLCAKLGAGLALTAAAQGAAAQSLSVAPASSAAGVSVSVSWSGITNASATDWIGLYRSGAAPTAFVDWLYVGCSNVADVPRASGSCPFALPPSLPAGGYELRLHTNNTYTRIATSGTLNVTAAGGTSTASLSVTPGTVAAGASVTVSWSGIASAAGADWFGLFRPGSASTAFIDWLYVSCGKSVGTPRASGSCPFVVPANLGAGSYELRLHSNNSYTSIATSGALNVTAASGGGGTGDTSLTVNAVNASAPSIKVYPADAAGLGTGNASFGRNYSSNTRVWLTAPLRSGNNYFIKWQRNGVDYDNASTTSVLIGAASTLTAVYEIPSCSGINVAPGTDSIRAAVASAPAGSTFCIQAGVHRFTTTVVARANNKFIGVPGAILNGSKILPDTGFVREGTYWVMTGQTQQEPLNTSSTCTSSTPACVYPERVFLSGQDLVQVTRLADLSPGKFFFDYGADKIYLYDNPAGRLVEATTGSGGIIGYLGGGQASVTIKNLVFEKFGGGEVSGSAHNVLKTAEGWRVENNEFRFNSEIGVASFGGSLVRNNDIHHNGRYGLNGDGQIEGNNISFNNTDGFEPDHDAGGTKFHGTRGLVIRGNTMTSNKGPAVWADYDNYNMTYENNVVENNFSIGIFHEVSCAGVIRNNVVRGNNAPMAGQSLWWGAQIYTRSSKDLEIVGNDVSALGAATHAIGVRGGDAPLTGPVCGTLESRNVSVHDNIIRLDAGDFSGVVGADGAGYGVQRNLKFLNNTYYLTDPAGGYFWYDAARGLTKEQWQAVGQDATGRFLQQ
jgi:hypothetical protein